MPQEIRVLCCYSCEMYQVDIVKKAKKWQCKMCGAKQSVLKEFFRGTGAECRQRAQELNFTTKTKQSKVENELLDLLENNDIDLEAIAAEERKHCVQAQLKAPEESKWAKFIEGSKENSSTMHRVEFVNNLKRKSSPKLEDLNSVKSSKSFASTSSKWNAYL